MALSVEEIGVVLKSARQRMATKDERWGQALFNSLHYLDPELANEVRGTEADPFYDDARVDAFYSRMAEDGL